MKNLRKNILCGLIGFVLGAMLFNSPEHNKDMFVKPKVVNNIPQNSIDWNVVDVNYDGFPDELITPHRNSWYGTKGPVYSSLDSMNMNQPTEEGNYILFAAHKVITYKNAFSKMAGSDKEFYWLCRVDDLNNDGVADKISWPRMGDKMPGYEQPFLSKDVQYKANQVLLLENQIQTYIKSKISQ